MQYPCPGRADRGKGELAAGADPADLRCRLEEHILHVRPGIPAGMGVPGDISRKLRPGYRLVDLSGMERLEGRGRKSLRRAGPLFNGRPYGSLIQTFQRPVVQTHECLD